MLLDKALSPQRLRLDISTITIIKNTKRGGRLEEGNGGSLGLALSLSPSHRLPRALFFPLPSLPTTQRGLCGGDRMAQQDRQNSWASEQIELVNERKGEKKHGKYLKETREETTLPRSPFGKFVLSISTYPPCKALSSTYKKKTASCPRSTV